MNKPYGLSAVIITLNEEANIARCIESLLPVADEIIVVDSFSTDQTKEICIKYPVVRFIEHAFEGHIGQKNFALQQAQYPYVLSLDADESLSKEAQNSILKEKQHFTADGYTFNRLTNYCGKWIKHGGWYPDKKLRLVNKSKAIWKGINPHDVLCLNTEGTIVHLKGDILHYSVKSIEDHIQTVQKFSSIAAEARFNNGVKSDFMKIFFHPFWKFLRNYFFKLGFLDGYYGFVIARISAFSTFLRYVKLRQLWKERGEKNK